MRDTSDCKDHSVLPLDESASLTHVDDIVANDAAVFHLKLVASELGAIGVLLEMCLIELEVVLQGVGCAPLEDTILEQCRVLALPRDGEVNDSLPHTALETITSQ